MRRALTLATILLAAGCATNAGPAGPEPEVTLIQLSRVAEGTQYETGPVSAHYAVEVKNTTTEPLRLARVNLQSVGGGSYTLPAYSQGFDETIAPGATKRVSFWAPAFVSTLTVAGANGPVTLRGMLDFDSTRGKFQTVVVQNVAPSGGN